MIIELIGMPRAGKTTVIERLQEEIPGLKAIYTAFDLNPFPQKQTYEYNLWYLKYIIREIENIKDNSDVVVAIERGIIDRYAFNKALLKYGRISDKQYESYLLLMKPYLLIDSIGYVFNISPKISLSNVRSNKGTITNDKKFLKVLHNCYKDLRKQAFNLCYLSPEIDSEKHFGQIINNLKRWSMRK